MSNQGANNLWIPWPNYVGMCCSNGGRSWRLRIIICASLIWFSFYPVFPPPMDVSHEVNLDVSRSKLLDLDRGVQDYTPHILLVPSRLKQFSKVGWFLQNMLSSLLKYPSQRVDGVTFINPSSVSKSSYAFLRYSGQEGEEGVNVDIRKL